MEYHFTRIVPLSFDDAIARVTDELKKEGFGVLTEIDVRETLKKKLKQFRHGEAVSVAPRSGAGI